MMAKWKECALGDLGVIVGGATPSTKKPEHYNGGTVPWLTPKDLSGFPYRRIGRGERNITKQGLNSCSTRLLPEGSVLFTSRAPIGYVAIAENALCTNQGFKSVIPNADTDSLFLYYLLKFNKDEIERLGSGTTFKEVSGTVMRGVRVKVPEDIRVQKRISSLLGALDDKIELNTRMNDNLLQQAQAVFSYYASRSDSTVPFTSLIDVLGGGTPKTGNPKFWNGDIPFFTPKDAGRPYTFHTEKYLSREGLEHCASGLYPVNTALITARGTVGKVSLAGVPMAMNQSCYALAGKGIAPVLVYFYALQAVQNLKHKATGAVFDAIVTRDFETETIRRLTPEDSAAFCETANAMFKAIHNNSLENLRLLAIRDALLPRLMSGELDVSEAPLA